MLEFFAKLEMNDVRLVRFIETQLRCGLMQRSLGSGEMIWSRGMFNLLGLDPETDRPSFALLQSVKHPDDRLTIDEIEASYDAASVISRTFRVIRSDGSMRVLSQHGEILFNSEGRREKLVSAVIDVTESEHVRDQAKRMSARWDSLSRHSGLTLFLARPDGYVTQVLGGVPDREYKEARSAGLKWRDMVHPDDREETVRVFEEAGRALLPATHEHRVIQADKSYRWQRETRLPVFNTQHDFAEYVCFSQDIEKEKSIGVLKDASQPITGAQVRMGRSLARWTVQQLADAANVSPSTIRRIEDFDGVTANAIDVLESIRKTLCANSVQFIFPPAGKPGVRPG